MRKLVLIWMLWFTCITVYPQVNLKLVNQEDQPITGAVLECDNGFKAVSDQEGIITVEENSGKCLIRHVSYKSVGITIGIESDTIILQDHSRILPDLIVYGYQEPVRLSEAPGGYSYLDGRDFEKFSAVTPVTAFNSLPGVRMEQRSPSSYRINIRGSTLRSPFGVRNVKVYWNRIPITEPTGSTPLNMLDLAQFSNFQIIRGPSGSIYGAGTGGVLLMDNDLPSVSRLRGNASISFGSFNMFRADAGLEHQGDNHSLQVTVSNHQSEGYREHSEFNRSNFNVSGQYRFNEQEQINYHVLYGDLFYQLPGGLTEEQRDNDPRQARSASVAQNSTLDQKYLFSGLEYRLVKPQWSNETTVFFSTSNKRNPFITNYEFEDLSGGGFRTRFSGRLGGQTSPFLFTGGTEWQWGSANADNFGNQDGNPDTLRYVDRNKQVTGFEFLKLSYSKGNWRFEAAGSLNHLNYTFNRERDVALDSAYQLERSFDPVFTPRFGVVYTTGNYTFHASYGQGFSPPVLDEIRTSDATINIDLNAERARNYELGMRGSFIDNRLSLDLNVFYMQLENTIVSQIAEDGTSTFFNSGKTNQRGLELLAGWEITRSTTGLLRYAYLKSAITWYHFRFKDYIRAAGDNNIDYSGNELTGAPEFSGSGWLVMNFWDDIQLDINYQHVSRIPLNDANSVYSRAFDLVQVNFSWQVINRSGRQLEIFGGVDNLLNESYSLGNDLNAFGNRYFNPAATRNYFGGLRYQFSK